MPGLLVTNNSGTDARQGQSRKRTHDGKLVNGARTPRKDTPASNLPPQPPTMNGAAVASVAGSAAVAPAQLAQLPPELAHLGPEFYQPLTKLLQRASQETFNDLNDLLHGMANIPIPQQSNGVLANGYGGHSNRAQDTSEANKQKKLMLIKFAQDNRAKFIKLLVLTEWGRKSALDVSKVIDLFQFVKGEEAAIDNIDGQLERIKVYSNHARQPNPDIRTALQILSKGKAEWIPDMGLIPPAPLSPEKVLNLFRYLNTSLAVRLNVHEHLPRHLRKWRIGSGRVTFVVDSEFELDVFAFSEDTSKPWYFLDLRLLFTPAPSIALESRFQAFFKAQLDTILANAGLSEAYDFLHNFVLTHKIAVLRSQAHQLSRAGWAGSIKVEPVHRSLIVQYWTDRPGKKSWFEIGLSSGKPKNGKVSWRGPPVPSLAVRWFRQGVQVQDVDLRLDFHDLSLERMLKRIIALHIGHQLQAARNAIPTKMRTKATLSETEPCDCSLDVSLGRPDNSITLSLEPVAGRYTLRPQTSFSARAEHAINHAKDPVASIGPNLTQLLAQTLQESIERHSQQLGWQIRTAKSLEKDSVKLATNLDVLQLTLYHPQGWNTNWVLAAIIDAFGESWWCLQTDSRTTTIRHSVEVAMKTSGPRVPISRTSLASVERVALQQLAFWVNKRALDAQNILSDMKSEVSLSSPSGAQSTSLGALRGWVLHMRTADLLAANPGEDPWLEPGLRVTFHGFDADHVKVSHIATGTIVKSVAADMQKLMSASPPAGFTFSDNGTFAILLSTPFGEPMINELKARLRDVDRLRSFTTILQQRKLKLIESSLQQVKFQYGQDFKASVNFGQENDIQVHLSAGNPHNRIRTFLTEIINERSPFFLPGQERKGLDRFCETLLFTRPILSILTRLENAIPGNLHNPAVKAHHVGNYRITYANPLCSFDIKLRAKEDRACWHIEDNIKRQPDSRPSSERNPNHKRLESLQVALNTLFKKRETGWYGIRAGILADIDGIPGALRALHQTVMACAVDVSNGVLPYVDKSTSGPVPAPAPQTNGNANANGNVIAQGAPAPTANMGVQPQANGMQGRKNFPNVGKPTKKERDVIEID